MAERSTGRLLLIALVIASTLAGVYLSIRLFNAGPWARKRGIGHDGGVILVYDIRVPPGSDTTDLSGRMIEAMSARVDPDDILNLAWRPLGPTRIEIEIPLSAFGDLEDFKRLLRGLGVLDFRILVDDPRLHSQMAQRLLNEGPVFKPGDEVRWFELGDPQQAEGLGAVEHAGKHWALAYDTPDKSMVHRQTGLPWGLEYARRGSNPNNPLEPVIDFKLDSQGGALFADLTGANVGKKLAILLDDKMISAPVLRSRIGAQGQISGSYTNQELNYLIRTLNAGTLPAPLEDEPVSERHVAPRAGATGLATNPPLWVHLIRSPMLLILLLVVIAGILVIALRSLAKPRS